MIHIRNSRVESNAIETSRPVRVRAQYLKMPLRSAAISGVCCEKVR